MTSTMRFVRVAPVVLALLVFTACGDDDSTSPRTPPATVAGGSWEEICARLASATTAGPDPMDFATTDGSGNNVVGPEFNVAFDQFWLEFYEGLAAIAPEEIAGDLGELRTSFEARVARDIEIRDTGTVHEPGVVVGNEVWERLGAAYLTNCGVEYWLGFGD